MAEEPVTPSAGELPAGTPAATSGASAAGGTPASAGGTPAAGAVAQTPEQIKAAADAEALRVSTLTPEQKAAEATAKAAADKAAAEVPADYTALKMPDGYKVDPADPVFGKALTLFGKNKLTPEGAQEFLDFTVDRDKALAQAINDHASQQWEKQAAGWKTATEKEFSAEDLGGGKTAAAQVFDKDTLAYLEGLKLTSNPGFVRGMVKVFKAIKDDTWVTGNAPNGSAARTPQQMFPNSKMNP